jgi:hypothetical protein
MTRVTPTYSTQELPTWVHRHLDSSVLPQHSRYTSKHTTHAHVAILFKGRKVLAIGQNRVGCRTGGMTVHAEADVIRTVGDVKKLDGAVLVVVRIAPTGIRYSKPCHACQCLIDKCMREYGLRGCIHS